MNFELGVKCSFEVWIAVARRWLEGYACLFGGDEWLQLKSEAGVEDGHSAQVRLDAVATHLYRACNTPNKGKMRTY